MIRWEYATYKVSAKVGLGGYLDAVELGRLLDHYGAQGWELVHVLETNYSEGATRDAILIFKRPAMDGNPPAFQQ